MNATKPQLDNLVAFLEAALPKLLPGEKIRTENGIVYGAGDGVTIQETEIERPTIAGTKTFPGWSVSTWHTTHYTQWDPPDVEEKEIGQYPSWSQAAEAFLVEIFRDRINGEFERLSRPDFS